MAKLLSGTRIYGNLQIDTNVAVLGSNVSTSTTTGAVVVTGGVGIGNVLFINNTGDVSANVGNLFLGNILINANLGAYQTYANATFGIGTYSNTNVAAYLNSQNITSANIGAFQTYANTKIGTNSNGNLVITSTTTSTNATTGALVVAGGVGINQTLSVNTSAYIGGNTAQTWVGGYGRFLVVDSINPDGSVARAGIELRGGSAVGSGLQSSINFISRTTAATDVNSARIAVTNSTGSTVAGVLRFYTFSSGVLTEALRISETQQVNVLATTTSTSTTTGALIVAGGAGIAGNVYTDKVYTTLGVYWSGNGQAFTSTTIANTAEITSNLSSGQNVGLSLTTTGVVAGNYGSATSIPTIVVDSKGRITSITSNVVSTTINLAGGSGSGSVAGGGTFTVTGTTNQITTSVASSTITIAFAQDITAPGNLTVAGNLTVQGNTLTIGSNNLTVVDSIIDLHTFANLDPLISDDGRDIGFRFHYYKDADTHAFLGWENDTQTLIYLQNSTETSSNVSGTYGNVQFGSLLLSNTTEASSTTTGALQVRGGAGFGANIFTSGWIIPTANTTQNLGSSTNWWDTIYGVSQQARYADLAENYAADQKYAPGTVVVFGGDQEITTTTITHDTRVAGVISTNPGYLMNAASEGLPVALTGRVPCRVRGPVNKGTVLVTSDTPGVAEAIDFNMFRPGCVLGKSLENIANNEIKTIEVVVGRF